MRERERASSVDLKEIPPCIMGNVKILLSGDQLPKLKTSWSFHDKAASVNSEHSWELFSHWLLDLPRRRKEGSQVFNNSSFSMAIWKGCEWLEETDEISPISRPWKEMESACGTAMPLKPAPPPPLPCPRPSPAPARLPLLPPPPCFFIPEPT